MQFKTRIILVVIFTAIFQFILGYYFHLHIDNPIWWAITGAYVVIQPLWQNPLGGWIDLQISLYRERRERRRKYEFYRDKVKAGSVPVNDFEDKAKEVIK